MARIPYPDDGELSAETSALIAAMPKLNLIRMMAHAEGTIEGALRVSDGVLNRSILDPFVRQAALLRLCKAVGSHYEWLQHETVSRRIGMRDDEIAAASAGGDSTLLKPVQLAAMRLAEELAVGPRASDAALASLRPHMPARGLVELVMAIGFYIMQSRVIETLGVDVEAEPVPLPAPAYALERAHYRETV